MSKEKFSSVGGQAVIEGVMMRNADLLATAVRKPNGDIVYKKTKISKSRNKLSTIPFIRGAITLFDSLVLGVKELTFSANQAEVEEEQLSQKEAVMTTIVSLALGIGLFIVLPSVISSFLFRDNKIHSNLLEAGLRLSFFVLYIFLISFSKDIQRVFQYHGAEHKSIYAYEQHLELTPENAKKFTTLHPRCGTSFLLIVMFIAIIVFTGLDFILPPPTSFVTKLFTKVILRVLFMPLIAGISYELQRYTSNHLDNWLVKLIAAPGMALQRITTKEPDLQQLEVAIVAIKVVLNEPVENAIEVY
ncbi:MULTISPECIES: DUF1385 domain-containing protein [Cetobacterium]|nr:MULTISPECIES: DUF1385 domain-containing protein [Cetobacterium]MBC2853098.1 DUF1385 domain-containing protein [Cetobacterium sp. 2G large]MCQ9625456.1 DUF1385 domain-containing protein [Cetobacterium somerae]MCX3066391.1 DUF1385 domain-containing protein [Cetobacterium somerae]UPO96861.1 DUF1385 domain-containing protein [Cetobacterium somerae]WVJ01271.1 DUF1385 domain-containing protein [Cetobacterium somerae]